MRSGALLYVALILAVLYVPALFWAPGARGVLEMFGLSWLEKAVTIVFAIAIVVLLFSSALEARGSYHWRKHVRDMAVWGVAFVTLVAIVR